jgi:hypothetical protein
MMCRVLALKTASKRCCGQAALTSNAMGAGVLGSAASSSQARMPARFAVRSAACQLRWGSAAAK